MKVLILAPSFWPATKAGGPARSLTNLAIDAASQHEVTVLTADRDLGDSLPFSAADRAGPPELAAASVHYVDVHDPSAVWRSLRSVGKTEYDLVVMNSIWHRTLSVLPALAIATGRIRAARVVLMPRGELETGALALKSRRKAIAAGAARRLYARAADLVAATSDSEEENLRAWFPNHPCLRVSNSPDRIPAGFVTSESGVLRVLFLGRIHPTKGTQELIRAVGAAQRPIRLTLAGPVGDESYWGSCRHLIDQLPEAVTVDVRGPVDRGAISELLWSHDLMATLTLGENFGHTIAESLQAGCPVLATSATPWTPILRETGGFVINDRSDIESIASVLRAVADLEREQRVALRSAANGAYRRWCILQAPDVVSAALGYTH